MLRKARIIGASDTKSLPGSLVDIHNFTDADREAFRHRKHPTIAKSVLLGITRASLETESFLSAASFQETTRVLTDVVIKGKRNDLLGLKENIIAGELIPAGTGVKHYSDVKYEKTARPVVGVESQTEVAEQQAYNRG